MKAHPRNRKLSEQDHPLPQSTTAVFNTNEAYKEAMVLLAECLKQVGADIDKVNRFAQFCDSGDIDMRPIIAWWVNDMIDAFFEDKSAMRWAFTECRLPTR